MSVPKKPEPAKLVIGVFLKDKSLLKPVADALGETFGKIDLISPWLSFDFTDYYESEMGRPLYRRMISFIAHIRQADLADIKRHTNAIEGDFAVAGKRRVNIDPGYLIQARFVLATGKNYSHRIYIGKGIYADLTLIYAGGEFTPLPWTYPDYRHVSMCEYLARVRKKYVHDLKMPPGEDKGATSGG